MNAKMKSGIKLQDLPFDCLYCIFRYLSVKDKLNFWKVSSEWIDLHSSIWQISEFAIKCIHFIENEEWEEPEFIPKRTLELKEFKEIMINVGPILKKFCIFVSTDMSDAVYAFDGKSYRIKGSIKYKAAMGIVIKNCHNLKKLEIRVYENCANLTKKCHALFLANQELVDVKLVFRNANDRADLKKVISFEDAPGPVKHLCLDIDDVPPKTMKLICELLESRKVNLEELRFKYCYGDSILPLMQVIANYAKDIRVLCFSSICDGSVYIEDKVHSMIARNCKKLQEIKLHGPNVVTDEGLRTLMTGLPNLISVTLFYVDVHSVDYSNVQYSLKSLKIKACPNLSEDALKKISLLINLEELHISSDTNCTDNVIKEITFSCKKLKKVTIVGGTHITGNGMNALVTGIPNLESVVLEELDVDFTVQSNAHSRIRSLKIWGSYDIANNFKAVAIFKNLEELSFKDLTITDETLSLISSGCKQLTKFTLSGISGITSEAIYAFGNNLPNLKYLGLDNNIPKDELKTLFTRIPHLEYYH